MDDNDRIAQQDLHNAIEKALHESSDLDEDQILTGWVICYETTSLGASSASAGHFYGPREMTTWRSLGLIEWVRRFGLWPDNHQDDNSED